MADRGQQTQFYRPYDSEEESGSDSGSESDSWFSFGIDQQAPPPPGLVGGHPNFRAFASQNQLLSAAGRSFSTVQDQLAYGTDKLGKYTTYSYYESPIPELEGENEYGRTRFTTAEGTETSLVLIDSRYRDRQAYPQPTQFTLKLPRIYKNVTNITLSDVKLLTSFYFFRLNKGNTDITVYENGRTTLTYENTLRSTIVKRYITEGSYNIDGLQQELQLQLNYTPLFFDFPNGFDDFITQFRASGDYSLNFNLPGDYFFNNTTNIWIPNPTVNTIVTYFWRTRYAGLTTYSLDQVLLAYYYPVLNEYLFDENYEDKNLSYTTALTLDPTITTVEEANRRILYDFQGINPPDPIVLAMINANRLLLDKYRLEHTFRYWLINKYIVGRDVRSQNIYITSPSLNTSLVNLLNQQTQRYFTRALQLNNLSLAQYSNIQTNVDRALAVLQDMYNYEQTRFLNYFAVPWSQYTLSYYATLEYQMFLRNGLNITGVPRTDSEAVDAGVISYSNDVLLSLRSNPPYYWPNMSNLTDTISFVNCSSLTSTLSFVYNVELSNFIPKHTIVEGPQDYIYSEYLTKSANAVCPIEAGKYTVFRFHSPVRQTMQVETLPRPSIYRVLKYNQSNFNGFINQYFDMNYYYQPTDTYPYPPITSNYLTRYDNTQIPHLLDIPGWSTINTSQSNPSTYSFGNNLSTSLGLYPSSIALDVTEFNRALYMQFITPEFPNASSNSNYTYQLNLSVYFYSNETSGTLVKPIENYGMFLYHDRGGFQGDITQPRNENVKFFKTSTIITSNDFSGTIQFTAYPLQTYYVSLRADNFNFGNSFPRIVPWFSTPIVSTVQTRSIAGINPGTDIYSSNFSNSITSNWNYAQLYDSNWIQLPTNSNLWPPDPSDDIDNQYLALSNTPIGYDTNNVSTDYTDYVPYIFQSFRDSFAPYFNLGLDPITQFLFQSNSPYNSTTQTYLYSGGLNSVYLPGLQNTYTPAVVNTRQEKIVHYYSLNYIPESLCNAPFPDSWIGSCNESQLPYTISTTANTPIPGYSYKTTASTIQLDHGVLGFNFIPDEGVWDVKRIAFRSAIENYDEDPNSQIKYLGVYNMGTIIHSNTADIKLSTAIIVLSNSARVTYTSTFTFSNNGFDVKGGSYYEFRKDSSFINPTYPALLGYGQLQSEMSDQPESMYTFIAFDQYGTPTPIKALSGSAIPFPLYNNTFVSSVYLDGTPPYYEYDYLSTGVVFPSTIGQCNFPYAANSISSLFAPPPNQDGTQSLYALSMPIGTSVLNIKKGIPYDASQDYLQPWSTILTPTNVYANVSNHILLQDTNFNIYEYNSNDPQRNLINPKWELSPDAIYPTYEYTSLVGVAANSKAYYFLGFSNLSNPSSNTLRLKGFNPITGVLFDYPLDATFTIPVGGTLRSFTINDYEQMVITYQNTTNDTNIYYNTQPSTNMATFGILSGQSTAVHTMDPKSSTIYYLLQDYTSNYASTIAELDIFGSLPGKLWRTKGPSGTPTSWSGLAVNSRVQTGGGYDSVYLYSADSNTSNIYGSITRDEATSELEMRILSTSIVNVSNVGQPIVSIAGGYSGSIWVVGSQTPNVWGYRNTNIDVPGLVEAAWQIFYPFQKIVLEQIANTYNPITDLRTLDYPEYPHTAMFYYRDGVSFSNDIDTKWGLESSNNFLVGDPNMAGYYFNSYTFNVPLVPSSNTDYQYLVVRGYSPTENSAPLIRFNLTNKYNFGYASQLELIDEIANYDTIPRLYNSNYANVILQFDAAFQQSNSFFGANLIPNFDGSNFNTSNFAGFASNVSTIYNSYQSNANLLSNITSYVNSNITYYISTNLGTIIPPQALNRVNYTDPITFSLLWKSGLSPQYANLLEDWGLGYNLGYIKMDTPLSTYHRATSFYKILEDYIYLRLNPEFQMNRMDTTFREDFKITRDSTGAVQNFHGKLILNNFNTFSQSFIYNNTPFNPPLGKLDSMYFEWVNYVGDVIDNNDCEWTASIVITEQRTKATVDSTIPRLPPMQPLRK